MRPLPSGHGHTPTPNPFLPCSRITEYSFYQPRKPSPSSRLGSVLKQRQRKTATLNMHPLEMEAHGHGRGHTEPVPPGLASCRSARWTSDGSCRSWSAGQGQHGHVLGRGAVPEPANLPRGKQATDPLRICREGGEGTVGPIPYGTAAACPQQRLAGGTWEGGPMEERCGQLMRSTLGRQEPCLRGLPCPTLLHSLGLVTAVTSGHNPPPSSMIPDYLGGKMANY